MNVRPTVAIIGSGISGLTAAYFLQRHFQITVFEGDQRIGGHTNTRTVDLSKLPVVRGTERNRDSRLESQLLPVDTGFIVFNDRTYPNFIRLLENLGVASQATEMSFSVQCEATGIEYCGSTLNTYFAQRRNVLRPSFYQFLWDFRRFARQAAEYLDSSEESQTVGEFFAKHRYSDAFYRRYFLPMGSAIWSCPQGVFEQFPIRFICQFYHHHGLLTIKNRPQWRVICGGSKQYLQPLTSGFADRIVTGAWIDGVQRVADSQGRWLVNGTVANNSGATKIQQHFDHVVFACHSDQALQMLGSDLDGSIREILAAFPYQLNMATLHVDDTVLPKNRRTWAAWNYHLPRKNPAAVTGESDSEHATVTYNMNRLQRFTDAQTLGHTLCVTLNDDRRIDPHRVIDRFRYSHPIFSVGRLAAQQKHDRLIDHDGLSFCGAYWGNGFHEDGVNSALKVAEKLLGMNPWKAVSIPDGSNIAAFDRSNINSGIACS